MKLLALVLMAQVSGQPVTLDEPGNLYRIEPISVGEASPLTGRVVDTSTYISLAQRLSLAEAERDSLRAAPTTLPWQLVALLVLAGVAGGAYLGVKIAGVVRQ